MDEFEHEDCHGDERRQGERCQGWYCHHHLYLCGNRFERYLSGNYKLDHTKKEASEPVDIELINDGTIAGGATGTWKIEEGTSYITLKINSTYYHGVMVEQTLESTNTKTPAFTAIAANTGTTAWGYQTEGTTGITDIQADKTASSLIYDLNGRRVNNSQRKGIFIRNGKKYIVR